MKLDTECMPDSKVKVVLTAESEDTNKAFEKTYNHLRQQGQIPGFRPGKAPVALIKRHYGEELIQKLAWGTFVEDIYAPALEESDLQMIFHPELPRLEDVEDFAEGQPVQVETVVTVHPKPELPDYKALRLIKAKPEVSDEDVEEQLQELREVYADEVEVERDTVAEGDLVQVAMKIVAPDGEVLEESQSEFVADRESDQPVVGKLTGYIVGQVVTDETPISEDFDDPELAGQNVKIEATIKSIKERKLPELDDDFAKDVDEQLENLEALRARIRQQLETARRQASERRLRDMATGLLMQGTQIELPQELIDNVAASQVQSYIQRLQGQGMSVEESVEAMRDDEQAVSSQAVEGLKLHYIFDAIAESEDIEISDEALQAAIPRYAEENDIDEQMVHEAIQVHEEMENRLRNFALQEQVIQILLENAEIEEVPWDAYELHVRRHTEQYEQELRETVEGAESSPEVKQPAQTIQPEVNEQSEED